MLIYGDSDMFRPEHMVKFYQLLGGGLKDAGCQREHMSQNRWRSCEHHALRNRLAPANGRRALHS